MGKVNWDRVFDLDFELWVWHSKKTNSWFEIPQLVLREDKKMQLSLPLAVSHTQAQHCHTLTQLPVCVDVCVFLLDSWTDVILIEQSLTNCTVNHFHFCGCVFWKHECVCEPVIYRISVSAKIVFVAHSLSSHACIAYPIISCCPSLTCNVCAEWIRWESKKEQT